MSERLNALIEKIKNKQESEQIKLEGKRKKKESTRRKKLYQKNKKKKERLRLKKGIDKKIPYSWRIIITSRRKKLTEVLYCSNKEDALKKYGKILTENKLTVRFPVKYIQLDDCMVESNYEILLMKKNSETNVDEVFLRNEYGQLIPHKTNTKNWVLYQKNPYYLEETFWVYGFHPLYQRKDFNYILNEIVLFNIYKTKYLLKKVMVFRNKLLIENDDDFDIVICKNKNDCIRLYNELEKECVERKIKQIMFFGFVRDVNRKTTTQKIMEKTGWDKVKVNRDSTKP